MGGAPRRGELIKNYKIVKDEADSCFDAPPTHLTAHALEPVRRRESDHRKQLRGSTGGASR